MRARALIVVMAILVGGVRVARAEVEEDDGAEKFSCGKPKGRFEVNLKDEVALRDLIAWAMGFSCKRFVYASSLAQRSAKLTMITPGTLDASEAWSVFEVGLDSMGLTAVPKGKVLEIVESAQAKDAALAIRKTFPDGGGGLVRVLVKPEFVSVDEMQKAFELVKSRNGVVTALPALRALIVTDDGRHAAAMKTLARDLDRPMAGAGLFVIPVEHRPAEALLEVLNPLINDPQKAANAGGTDTVAPRLVADSRVNSLFVIGSAADHARIAAIVEVLDSDQGDDAQMSSVRLRNARASEVLTALQPLVTSNAQTTATAGAVAGPVKLSADEGTNSILMLASPRDSMAVRAMLEQLDAPRRQIYIEAMVLEVSSNRSRELAASWHGGKEVLESDSGTGATLGSFGSSDLSSIGLSSIVAEKGLSAVGDGFLGGIMGSPFTLLGQSVPSLGVLFKAVATSDELEVLASPHIMTMDNKASTISVGQNIPYKSKEATSTQFGTNGPNIERQKVALTLKITPHVAPAEEGDAPGDERIRLDIEFEHNQLGSVDFQGLGPTWKERKLETSIVLRDQDTYVLGGLIDERVEHVATKIPLLGDIPVLGVLFRSTKTTKDKANLLIVITPQLIDDSAAGRAVFERRMREREEFLSARSSLSTRVASPRVDYKRKRGLIAEIDASVRSVEAEKRAIEAIRTPERKRGEIKVEVPPAPAADQ